MSNKKSNEKIALKIIISNVIYVLKFAVKEDRKMVLGYIIGTCVFRTVNAIYSTLLIKIIIDMLVNKSQLNSFLLFLAIATVAVTVADALTIYLNEYFLKVRQVKANGNIQIKFFEKSAKMDLICYDNPDYFNDFVIAAQQSEDMMNSAITCVSKILGETFAILSMSAVVFTIHPIVAIFPVIGFFVNILTRFEITRQEYKFDMEKKRINRKSDYSRRVFYQPEYAKEIKLSEIEKPLRAQFYESMKTESKSAHKYGVKIALLSMVNWCFAFTALQFFAVPVYMGYLALVKLNIALGDVIALKNATDQIQWQLDQTNYALIDFQRIGQYAEKFRRFIEYKERIETENFGEQTCTLPKNICTLEIRNVSFSYNNDGNYVLKNVNMTIKPGEKIAIVGENGAGKTTLIKLIMRLYDVTEGGIFYGDRDIREYPIGEYRNIIGAVFQDYQIYSATLGENVSMNVYDSDSIYIETALNQADFGDKLGKLDNGISTELTREFSDDGTILSGGESQKVAIARILAKSENLLLAILDEPSSALDPRAEYALNTAMAEKAKSSSIIFISHRLSTTRSADKIYMFENGEITEQGTHSELMSANMRYAEMFEKQSRYYKLS
jgi:ATP-binding cassette subfamily B protein